MTLYARSDVASVSVPTASGGCGKTHTRPVREGAPVRQWPLDCVPCEAFLRDDMVRDLNKDLPKSQGKHVVGMWADSPLKIPQTPDEAMVSEDFNDRGNKAMAQMSAAMAQTALERFYAEAARETEEATAAQEVIELRLKLAETEKLNQSVLDRLAALEHTGVAFLPTLPVVPVPVDEPPLRTWPPDWQPTPGDPACPGCGGRLRRHKKGPAPKLCESCRKG